MNLRPIFMTIIVFAVTAGYAADIIVESRSGGQNNTGYRETAGRWLDSNTPAETSKSNAPGLTPQGEVGSRKTTVAAPEGTLKEAVLSSARFTPPIESAGDYTVYVTFPKAGNANPVTYFIKHAKGEEKKEVTQNGWGRTASANGNEWIKLGTYPFAPGSDQYVELQVTGATIGADPDNPAQAFADAVRFTTDPLTELKKSGTTSAVASTPRPGTPTTPAAATDNSNPITWQENLSSGRSTANAENKKLLVYFYSPQSERSTEYESTVLKDAKIKAVISQGYIAVRINMDAQRDLASQLQVFRAGTVNIYDSKTGNIIESISDTPEVNELLKRLSAVK